MTETFYFCLTKHKVGMTLGLRGTNLSWTFCENAGLPPKFRTCGRASTAKSRAPPLREIRSVYGAVPITHMFCGGVVGKSGRLKDKTDDHLLRGRIQIGFHQLRRSLTQECGRGKHIHHSGSQTFMAPSSSCGLRPPFQLIQLIYLRYLCVGTEREKRMDVCFLLTLYI